MASGNNADRYTSIPNPIQTATTAATGIPAVPGLPEPETVYLLRREHPQIQLTWASRFPRKVDKLKLRKAVTVFPIKVTLKADYDTNTKEFEYGCHARDVIFGGNINLNIGDQSLEYRKRFEMPNGTQLVFAGSCTVREKRLQPNFGVALEFGGENQTSGSMPLDGAGNAVWVGNHFDVRQRFSIARGFGVEVCGGVSLPAPTARYTHSSGTLALGEGAFHLHVAEVNAVLMI